jgi:hypothetical protein
MTATVLGEHWSCQFGDREPSKRHFRSVMIGKLSFGHSVLRREVPEASLRQEVPEASLRAPCIRLAALVPFTLWEHGALGSAAVFSTRARSKARTKTIDLAASQVVSGTTQPLLRRCPFRHKARSPQVGVSTFPAAPPDLRAGPGDHEELRGYKSARPWADDASYPVSVRRVAGSLRASFGRFLTVPPLRFASVPMVWFWGDFHLLIDAHAGRTCLALRASAHACQRGRKGASGRSSGRVRTRAPSTPWSCEAGPVAGVRGGGEPRTDQPSGRFPRWCLSPSRNMGLSVARRSFRPAPRPRPRPRRSAWRSAALLDLVVMRMKEEVPTLGETEEEEQRQAHAGVAFVEAA